MDVKNEPDGSPQTGLVGVPVGWPNQSPGSSQAHSQAPPLVPPPAHSVPVMNNKPPETYIDKTLIDAATAFQDGKSMTLPLKTETTPSTESSGSLPWALQNTLLQQYGQFMLDRMLNKSSSDSPATTSTVCTDSGPSPQNGSALAPVADHSSMKPESEQEMTAAATSLEAQRDAYRRMLNYSSALTQHYYLQCGYNYMQDRPVFPRSEGAQTTNSTSTVTSSSSTAPLPPPHTRVNPQQQLPSIDSVLLNLCTKKTRESTATTTTLGTNAIPSINSTMASIPAYGLQALANAAIEADPKAFSEAERDEHGNAQKAELEDISDSDDSNMSPSDSSTSQMTSPPRSGFSHILDNPHISIPSAHSQYPHPYPQNLLSAKAAMGTLPGIQHFSTLSQSVQKSTSGGDTMPSMTLPHSHAGMKPPGENTAMRLKVEPSEEKAIADRTIQEQIAAHQLHAVQQQVQDLTTGALSAGGLDTAALLAKFPLAASIESELQRHSDRLYDYDPEAMHALQQEPMQLTSDMPGKIGSRRKSRGRPTSIESQRDPLGRQTSTSSLGGTASLSGDERTYDCEICGKQFSHNDRLRRHRKIHTNEKPYKCDICGKGFKEKCNLKHHRYIHTGEKPYKCETCGKSFNQRSSLKTHQKVHTGEKPFKCDLCEKPFAQKYLLRQHMKKHVEINVVPPPPM